MKCEICNNEDCTKDHDMISPTSWWILIITLLILGFLL